MRWFKVRKPRSPAADFGGKKLLCYSTYEKAVERQGGEKLLVEHICGNLTHPTMFQINGSHLVSMLDAYCVLNKEPLPDLETHKAFLSTVCERIEPDKKTEADEIRAHAAKDIAHE
jgi:hypothetical protein